MGRLHHILGLRCTTLAMRHPPAPPPKPTNNRPLLSPSVDGEKLPFECDSAFQRRAGRAALQRSPLSGKPAAIHSLPLLVNPPRYDGAHLAATFQKRANVQKTSLSARGTCCLLGKKTLRSIVFSWHITGQLVCGSVCLKISHIRASTDSLIGSVRGCGEYPEPKPTYSVCSFCATSSRNVKGLHFVTKKTSE